MEWDNVDYPVVFLKLLEQTGTVASVFACIAKKTASQFRESEADYMLTEKGSRVRNRNGKKWQEFPVECHHKC